MRELYTVTLILSEPHSSEPCSSKSHSSEPLNSSSRKVGNGHQQRKPKKGRLCACSRILKTRPDTILSKRCSQVQDQLVSEGGAIPTRSIMQWSNSTSTCVLLQTISHVCAPLTMCSFSAAFQKTFPTGPAGVAD